jgi:polyhydroxyalkanoate synthesis regulator phasin
MLKEEIVGLFSKLFGSSSDIEKQLEELYIPIFQKTMGMSLDQAKKFFQDMFQSAKEESLKGNTKNLPQNYGDLLLEAESIDEKTKEMLAKKRREGVRDEDIRWWWNMHDYERWMMIKVDENSRVAGALDEIAKSHADNLEKAQEEAAKKVRKFFPMFGDPEDTTHTKGNDRPLPYELKGRIIIYIEERTKKDLNNLKKDIENSSTFNSLIRNKIKSGNL